MAIEVLEAVWGMVPEAVTPTDRLVLLALADHARPDGTNAFPKIATICHRTSLTRRAVQLSLDVLEAADLIRGIAVPGRTTVYRIDMSTVRGWHTAGQQGRTTCAGARRARRTTCAGAVGAHGGAPATPPPAHDVREGGALSAPDPSVIRQVDPPMNQTAAVVREIPGRMAEEVTQALLLKRLVHAFIGRRESLEDRGSVVSKVKRRAIAEGVLFGDREVEDAIRAALESRQRIHAEGRALQAVG